MEEIAGEILLSLGFTKQSKITLKQEFISFLESCGIDYYRLSLRRLGFYFVGIK